MRRRSKRHKPNPSAAAAPGVPSRGVAVAAAAAAAPLATPPPVPAPPHPVEEEEGDNDDEEPIVQSPQGANQDVVAHGAEADAEANTSADANADADADAVVPLSADLGDADFGADGVMLEDDANAVAAAPAQFAAPVPAVAMPANTPANFAAIASACVPTGAPTGTPGSTASATTDTTASETTSETSDANANNALPKGRPWDSFAKCQELGYYINTPESINAKIWEDWRGLSEKHPQWEFRKGMRQFQCVLRHPSADR